MSAIRPWAVYVRARRLAWVTATRAASAITLAIADVAIPVPNPEASIFLRHAFPIVSLLLVTIALPEPLGDFVPARGRRVAAARFAALVPAELLVLASWLVAVNGKEGGERITLVYVFGIGVVFATVIATAMGALASAVLVGSVSLLPSRITEEMLSTGLALPVSTLVAVTGVLALVLSGAAREPLVVR